MSYSQANTSHLSNGSSSAYTEKINGHHASTPSDTAATVDVRKIGQACLAGLKQTVEDLKEIKERVNVVEQSSAEKLGELDLRVSAVESSQQSLEALFHENKALRQSIEYLTTSVNPARQAQIEERQQETDSRIEELLKQVSAITTAASSSSAQIAQQADISAGQASEQSASAEAVQTSPGSVHSYTAAEHSKPPAVSPVQPSTYSKETVERVIARQSEHAGVLEECLHQLDDSAAYRLDSSRHGNDMTGLILPAIDFSIPLADRKSFEHKRDWVQAWQLKLEKLQNEMAQQYTHLSDKAKQLDVHRSSLLNSEEQVTEVGLRLREVTIGLLDEAQGIAEVKLMQEDHEDELLKRLREVEEREEAIRQDEYIISQKNRGAYEKQAADFRRKQTLSALKRELQNRIEAAHAIEAELAARNGKPSGLIAHLPLVDDLPSF